MAARRSTAAPCDAGCARPGRPFDRPRARYVPVAVVAVFPSLHAPPERAGMREHVSIRSSPERRDLCPHPPRTDHYHLLMCACLDNLPAQAYTLIGEKNHNYCPGDGADVFYLRFPVVNGAWCLEERMDDQRCQRRRAALTICSVMPPHPAA